MKKSKKSRAAKSHTKAKKVAARSSKKRRSKRNTPNGTDSNGRDPKGRFAKGNKLSEGHKSWQAKCSREFTEALFSAVSFEDIKSIIQQQVKQAKEGDNVSANIVLDRCCGKPKQLLEVGGQINFAMAIHEALNEK